MDRNKRYWAAQQLLAPSRLAGMACLLFLGPIFAESDSTAQAAQNLERPSATRDGKTITLRPSNLKFDIPKEWLEWHDKFKNNLHLTWEELDKVQSGGGEWDTEYAGVVNSVLPFERCAAHLGGDGWGLDSASYADLQVRIYLLDRSIEKIEAAIAKQGVAEVARIIESGVNEIHVERMTHDGWRRNRLSYDRFKEARGCACGG